MIVPCPLALRFAVSSCRHTFAQILIKLLQEPSTSCCRSPQKPHLLPSLVLSTISGTPPTSALCVQHPITQRLGAVHLPSGLPPAPAACCPTPAPSPALLLTASASAAAPSNHAHSWTAAGTRMSSSNTNNTDKVSHTARSVAAPCKGSKASVY